MPIILPGVGSGSGLTLLAIVQDVCAELGIQQPPIVIGSQDPQIQQLWALVNRLGNDLVREFEWQRLRKNTSVNTVAGQTTYDLPSDWNRQISQTEWNRTMRRPMIGPISAQGWEAYKGAYLGAGIETSFRIQGGKLVLLDEPPAGDELAYEYISSNWVVTITGSGRKKFLADDDSCVFDDQLMLEGLKLRWRKAKGLAYDEADYIRILDACKSQDQSAPVLRLGSTIGERLLNEYNIPEGGFGVTHA